MFHGAACGASWRAPASLFSLTPIGILIGLRSGGQRRVGEIVVERGDWELHHECSAAFRSIEALDAAAVLLHDAVADAEAQAGTFANGLGGEERIEHLLRRFDAWAGVREFDEKFFLVVRSANYQFAAADFFQRIHCIADQIEKNLQ